MRPALHGAERAAAHGRAQRQPAVDTVGHDVVNLRSRLLSCAAAFFVHRPGCSRTNTSPSDGNVPDDPGRRDDTHQSRPIPVEHVKEDRVPSFRQGLVANRNLPCHSSRSWRPAPPSSLTLWYCKLSAWPAFTWITLPTSYRSVFAQSPPPPARSPMAFLHASLFFSNLLGRVRATVSANNKLGCRHLHDVRNLRWPYHVAFQSQNLPAGSSHP